MSWMQKLQAIEALEDGEFDPGLVAEMERIARNPRTASEELAGRRAMRFSTPTFKEYSSSEIKGCGKNSFPAFSVTAGACALDCDHCQAKILEPMIPATTPEMLDRKVRDLILLQDLQGFLLSGGSNRRNEIKYEKYLPVVEGLKRDFPQLKVAIHSALLDEKRAKSMESAGVDTAMMDVIGSQETIREVYHLDRTVDEFEATLAALCSTRMEVVPHIVIGLHYGRILGEANALDICARHNIHSLVLVVVMPFYARPGTFVTPADRRRWPHLHRGPPPAARQAGAARLRPPSRHAQAGHRRLCRHGGTRRNCVSGRWCGSAVRSNSTAVRAAACLLFNQDWREHRGPADGDRVFGLEEKI